MRFSFPVLLSGIALLATGTMAAPLRSRSDDSSAIAARELSSFDLEARSYLDDLVSYDERSFEDDFDLIAREPTVDTRHFRIGIIIHPTEPVPSLLS